MLVYLWILGGRRSYICCAPLEPDNMVSEISVGDEEGTIIDYRENQLVYGYPRKEKLDDLEGWRINLVHRFP